MKNGIAVVAAAAALALAAGPSRADIEKGVKAGVSIANTSAKIPTSSGDVSPDAVTGLTAGVFVSMGLGPIAIAPEVLFTAKGFKYSTPGASALTVVNNFNYIDVPILLKYEIIPAGPVKPYLEIGPQISFLMTAKSKAELAGATTTTDVKDSLSSSDYAAVIDGGVSFGLGVVSLSADVRYGIGLADISKNSAAAAYNNVKNKNNVISILLGLAF